MDVGANIGLFAVYARCLLAGATVHCVEPTPGLVAALAENRLKYGIPGTDFAVGASSARGRAPMSVFPFFSLINGNRALRWSWPRPASRRSAMPTPCLMRAVESLIDDRMQHQVIDVDFVPLQEILDRLPPGPIDLLKIDVEGNEFDVLNSVGASGWRRVRRVVVECSFGKQSRIRPQTTAPGAGV